MPRKGLSLEEKRTRLRELLQDSAEFFNLKELEKLGPKRKGIVAQSVKEVVQSLVDDNLVNADKCGNQTVYWSLPSEETQKRRGELERLRGDLASKEAERSEQEAAIATLRNGRTESDERTELLARIEKQQARERELDDILHRFATLDPGAIAKLRDAVEPCTAGANRQTDNIYACQHYFTNKFNMEKKDFNKYFQVPEELDYIED